MPLLLASASSTRLADAANAGLTVTAHPARIDEDSLRAALAAEGASPRDIADLLAEAKARKVADKNPDALVLGCDQVLALKNQVFAKPETQDEARAQLQTLRGQTHQLLSAAVLYDRPNRSGAHVATARLTMRDFSDAYLDAYLSRTWPAISTSVGGYQIEVRRHPPFRSPSKATTSPSSACRFCRFCPILPCEDSSHRDRLRLPRIPLAGVIGHPIAHSRSRRCTAIG